MQRREQAMTRAAALLAAAALGGCGGGGDAERANAPPELVGLTDVTVNANESSAPLSFMVRDDGGAAAVTLAATSADPALLDDAAIVIDGGAAQRLLSVTPVAGRTGAVVVTLTASDAAGAQTTASLRVTVVPQQVSFSAFFRDAFLAAPNDAPRDLDSRRFDQDAGADDFDDLLRML